MAKTTFLIKLSDGSEHRAEAVIEWDRHTREFLKDYLGSAVGVRLGATDDELHIVDIHELTDA